MSAESIVGRAASGRPLSSHEARALLWPHLRALPAFRALIRSMEARLFQQMGPLPRPLLDVGSGEGHFASTVWSRVEVALDLHEGSLREAQRRGVYRSLVRGDGRQMPFRGDSFATVVSNCVVEHVPALARLLSEIFRVLQPGGRFIFSVPTDQLNASLGLTQLFQQLRAPRLAERYSQWFAGVQRHHHLLSPDEWGEQVERAGFEIEQRIGYLSARAARRFDVAHFLGLPNLLSHRLTGQWVLWPWRPRFALVERLLAPLVAEYDPPDATSAFFVARKPGGRR